MMKPPKSHVFISIGILVIFLALSIGTALTAIPGTDEGFFANPAFNLLTKGVFATTILETAATPFEGMTQHTYWIMPLQPLTLSFWYRVFGFSVFSTRSLSIVWGLVGLVSWFVIVRIPGSAAIIRRKASPDDDTSAGPARIRRRTTRRNGMRRFVHGMGAP